MSQGNKIIAIHQPNYIPWLGYFYKIFHCDIFVFHDDVQFSKKGLHNFHYIKTKDERLRLKIPVAEHQGILINEVRMKNELSWKTEHLHRIRDAYKKAPYFNEVYSDFESLLSTNTDQLVHFNAKIIQFICKKFGFEREFIFASKLGLKSSRQEKILDILSALNSTMYYSGTGAKTYQNEEEFQIRGIELIYSNFHPFEYPQFWGGFESNISIIDYLMHCGYNWGKVVDNNSISALGGAFK